MSLIIPAGRHHWEVHRLQRNEITSYEVILSFGWEATMPHQVWNLGTWPRWRRNDTTSSHAAFSLWQLVFQRREKYGQKESSLRAFPHCSALSNRLVAGLRATSQSRQEKIKACPHGQNKVM